MDTLERFMSRWAADQNSGCWMWTASLQKKGYGNAWDGHQVCTAHRLSWRLFRGPIPSAMHVLHKCDVRSCVNPDHLFLGTNADNMADKMAKGRYVMGSSARANKNKTHCKYGHPLSGDNLRARIDGSRACRTCESRKPGTPYARVK